MNFLKLKSILFSLILVLGFFSFAGVPEVASARGLVPCGGYTDSGSPEKPCSFLDIFALFARVTNWLIAIAGVYAVYNIIFASFNLVISQGNEEKITQNKQAITNAIIGLALTMMAFMLINFAVNYLLAGQQNGFKLDLTNPKCYLTQSLKNDCLVKK